MALRNGTSTAPARHDPDRLLAGYRGTRTQQALFELRGGPQASYDELIDETGAIRPAWTDLADAIGERGRGGLERLRSVVGGLVDKDGIASFALQLPRTETVKPPYTGKPRGRRPKVAVAPAE